MSRRGATLIEVLVVCSMFLVLMLAIWLFYDSTVRVERSITLHSDLDRTLMAAVRHVDSSLRSSKLLAPNDWNAPAPVQTIQLRSLKLDANGEALITPMGLPIWDEPFTIAFENQELVRIGQSRRSLGDFGENGKVEFLRKSRRMLEMTVVIEKVNRRGEKTTRQLTFPFRLFNQ